MSDFGTLKQRLGRRRGFDGNVDRLGGFINDAYLTLCSRRPTWSWLRRTRQFNTAGKYTRDGVTEQGAQFFQDSRTVVGYSATPLGSSAGATNTGAKIACPDSVVRRIAGGTSQLGGFPIFYMESNYPGVTTTAVAPYTAFSLYFDEYPLPAEATSVESLVATGNGWSVPIPQQSLLSPHMKSMPVDNDESCPRYYSVERHHSIPAPVEPPTLEVLAVSGSLEPEADYVYAYAYYNSRTLEMGPLSSPALIRTSPTERGVNFTGKVYKDYKIAIFRSRGLRELTSLVTGRAATIPSELFYVSVDVPLAGLTWPFQDTSADDLLGFNDVFDIASIYPQKFITSGQQHIRLWPPPDATYLVDMTYFIAPQEMVRDSQVPVTPRLYHNVILDLAEALCLSEEENHSAAAQKRSFALEMIQRMERDDDVDPATPIEIGRGTIDPYEAVLGNGRWPRNVTG